MALPKPEQTNGSKPSLLAGLDNIVDRHLQIEHIGQPPHYRHMAAYRLVARNGQFDGATLLQEAYSQIVSNWSGEPGRGQENWRWEPQRHISTANNSPEKRFEKAVVNQCPGWVNMIPVASGVVAAEGGRRIDLAQSRGPAWFEFIELKLGKNCDTPLFAAIEILGYGLAYLFSRRNCKALGYDESNELLSARRMELKVLAPRESYFPGSLQAFEREIGRGLEALVAHEELLELTFQFEQLPDVVEADKPCAAINGRSAVYPRIL
jgi:hypothetical protein